MKLFLMIAVMALAVTFGGDAFAQSNYFNEIQSEFVDDGVNWVLVFTAGMFVVAMCIIVLRMLMSGQFDWGRVAVILGAGLVLMIGSWFLLEKVIPEVKGRVETTRNF